MDILLHQYMAEIRKLPTTSNHCNQKQYTLGSSFNSTPNLHLKNSTIFKILRPMPFINFSGVFPELFNFLKNPLILSVLFPNHTLSLFQLLINLSLVFLKLSLLYTSFYCFQSLQKIILNEMEFKCFCYARHEQKVPQNPSAYLKSYNNF